MKKLKEKKGKKNVVVYKKQRVGGKNVKKKMSQNPQFDFFFLSFFLFL